MTLGEFAIPTTISSLAVAYQAPMSNVGAPGLPVVVEGSPIKLRPEKSDTVGLMTVRSALIIHALALAAAGCIHALPPRATPGPVLPPPDTLPLAPGLGRLYIDVVDGPVRVRAVKPITVTETFNGEQFEEEELEDQATCISPCVLDLPLGSHLLAFPVRGAGGVDLARVIVSPSPTLYRHALGWRQAREVGFTLGVLGASFGGVSFVTGGALLPVGLAKDSQGLTLAGGITLGVGALLTAAGIWAIAKHPLMEQAGAGAQYELPAGDER
jgi:hypothetical protein